MRMSIAVDLPQVTKIQRSRGGLDSQVGDRTARL